MNGVLVVGVGFSYNFSPSFHVTGWKIVWNVLPVIVFLLLQAHLHLFCFLVTRKLFFLTSNKVKRKKQLL